jgi:hypothetical protein
MVPTPVPNAPLPAVFFYSAANSMLTDHDRLRLAFDARYQALRAATESLIAATTLDERRARLVECSALLVSNRPLS